MKTLKIKFVDFWPDLIPHDNIITNALEEKYNVEISEKPDYIFYSVFGREHLKYNCIRIFFTGESIFPDFNICDYAIGYDFLELQDRYLRFPLYYWILIDNRDLYNTIQNRNHGIKEVCTNRKFCNFVYSNAGADHFRTELFYGLSEYRHIDSGGGYLNNIGRRVGDKLEFCKQYKFTIACENSVYPGYSTEKIIQAFIAETVPIYWGNPYVEKDFNSNSFINCHSLTSIQAIVEKVKYINENDEVYFDMLNQPILQVGLEDKRNELVTFLCNIFDQPIEESYRRNLSYAGIKYEKKMSYIKQIESIAPKKIIKKLLKWR